MDSAASRPIARTVNYGRIVLTLRRVLERQHISRNQLAKLTDLDYRAIQRLYRGEGISSVDLDFLARICYALNCPLSDLLIYRAPGQGEDL